MPLPEPRQLLRFFSRISIRLLAFNVLLVFLPVAGLWSLDIYEGELLRLQERSNVQQGRLLAAALGGRGDLDAAEAERILQNLEQRIDARLRVVDADFTLLADSSRLGPRLEETAEASRPEAEARESWLYRLGSGLYRLAQRLLPPEPPLREPDLYASGERLDGEEIREALDGSYGEAIRVSPSGRSLVLFSAIPIRSDERVVGVALVSKSTFSILETLYGLRLQMFKVVLVSVSVAIVLSLLVSTTIARPLRRLRNEARAILDPRGRLKRSFEVYRRLDEIGDLSRALNELTRRLESHIAFIESFASDVSHEFKNPLASIRNATELLAEVDDPAERQRFEGMVLRDVTRLEQLLAGVREITRMDAQREDEPKREIRLDELLERLVEQFRMRADGAGPRFELTLPEGTAAEISVLAPPGRLAQVFENLLDNARGFSPGDGTVHVSLAPRGKMAVVEIRDEGPGIPAEHLEKIFDRFFSYRPAGSEDGDGHTGLGLPIARTLVEDAGGAIEARNASQGGAVLTVELPVA